MATTHPQLARFLNRLDGVERTGDEQYQARCPAHDDQHASLALSWGDTGKVVAHCHAGCTYQEVLRASGVTNEQVTKSSEIVDRYVYTDEDGAPRYRVLRYEPKDFRQQRWTGRGRDWAWGLGGVERIPFHLPALAELIAHGTADDVVWIVEGEKDVLALESAYGIVATCNSGGAFKWDDQHSDYFPGFAGSVVIVADADRAGERHALAVHDSLRRVAGISAQIVQAAEGKDAAAHIAAGRAPGDFIELDVAALRAELDDAADSTAVVADQHSERVARVEAEADRIRVTQEARALVAAEVASATFSGFASVTLREALAAPREIVPPIIAGLQMRGHKATLTAQFKAGKTTLAGNLVRALADGEPFLDQFEVAELPGTVGVLDYELTRDDGLDFYAALDIRNTDRVVVESLRGAGFSLAQPRHRELVTQWLLDRDVAYWVLDPFGRALNGFGSENSNDDVRAFLNALDEVIAATGVVGTLMPVHTGRAQHEVGAEHGRGATVLDDDADARWLLTRDPSGRRFFRAEGRSGVGIEEVSLEYDRGTGRLSTGTVTRAESKGERFLSAVESHIAAHPGLGLNELRDGNVCGNSELAAAIKLGQDRGTIRIQRAGQKNTHYYVPPPKLSITREVSE